MISAKKIAYLVSQYPAINHTYILREIRALRNLGWNIEVASIRPNTRSESQLTVEEKEEAAHTWYVKSQGIWGAGRAHFLTLLTQPSSYMRGIFCSFRLGGVNVRKLVWNFLYFSEALIVGRWIRTRGLNHAHIHYASTVGMLMAKTFPITISITIHGSAEFEKPEEFHLREKIEASTFICAISNYGRNQLMKASSPDQWSKFEVVPLGIDPRTFVPGRSSIEHPAFEVMSVGTLTPPKAQRILIEAIARLGKEGRRIRLRLVGEGPDRKTLEKCVSDHGVSDIVFFEGALNQDQLRTLYRESDAFALASLAEGVPVVLMEAMAMEIPCVATRITGIPELITHEVDGLLVAPSDSAQLAAAIARLIDDPVFRGRIAKAGRRKILERYDVTKNIALLARVFESRIPVVPYS